MASSRSKPKSSVSLSLKKIQTIKKRSDFLNIIKAGEKIFPCKWLFLSFVSNNTDTNRFGLTISKQIGSAVVRNKLKRWCREFFATKNNSLISGLDINIVFRPYEKDFYKEVSHDEISIQLEKAWKKLNSEFRKRNYIRSQE